MEWRAYSTKDGESFGCVGYEDELTEQEAQERAEEWFGADVYVALKSYF